MRLRAFALLCLVGCLGSDGTSAKVRNPMSGQCEASNSSNAEWPACDSACTKLDQPACLASSTCHMAANVESGETGIYGGCWSLSTATLATGTCKSLGAEACATRSDCVTNFELGANAGAYMDCVDKTLYLSSPNSPPTASTTVLPPSNSVPAALSTKRPAFQ